MWAIQLPSGEFLELGQKFQMSFELNNQVFSGTDSEVLPGSYSFPADLPLSPANRRALSIPDRVDNSLRWSDIAGVRIFAYGKYLFLGTMRINSVTTTARITIIANQVSKLKQIELQSLSLGGARTWSGDFLDHMLDTARFPDNYDYVFFPVYNSDHNGYQDTDPFARNFQNYFALDVDGGADTGAFDDGAAALTPFVNLKYLLEQIFLAEDTGFSFQNLWQLTLELQRLYVYNNMDSRVLKGSTPVPDFPDFLALNKHLPKLKSTELLKKVMAHFGLGLFTNIFNKTIRLIPLQTLLQRPPARDWTEYQLAGIQIDATDDSPDFFNYPQTTDIPSDVPRPDTVPLFLTTEDFPDPSALDPGWYYIESQQSLIEIIDASGTHVGGRFFRAHRGVYFGTSKLYESGMDGFHEFLAAGQDVYITPGKASHWYEMTDTFGTTYEFHTEDIPVALMLYRGMQIQSPGEGEFPLACNHLYLAKHTGGDLNSITVNGTPVADSTRSMNWFGDAGLYNTAHRLWQEMLRNGKQVTMSFALPIAQLIDFSFEEKIRVGNMDYFVKRLRVQGLLGSGQVRVEATMFTVI